jgi:hypothetical protein
MQYAQGWDERRLRRCLKQAHANQLADFIWQRHQERFFRPINRLKSAKGNEQGYGFAMMGLCCLLVETIESYREGLPTTYQGKLQSYRNWKNVRIRYRILPNMKVSSKKTFRNFFRVHRDDFPGLTGGRFCDSFRNGLLHQGQSMRGWSLRRKGTGITSGKIVFRNNFAERLEECFKRYIKDLKSHHWQDRIWINASRKIWWLMRLS